MKRDTGISDDIRKKIVRLISALIPEAKIYLFGSRARGDYHEHSDIDLALDTGKIIEPRRRISEVKDVLEATHMTYRFDVLDINKISDELRNKILKEAIIWKD